MPDLPSHIRPRRSSQMAGDKTSGKAASDTCGTDLNSSPLKRNKPTRVATHRYPSVRRTTPITVLVGVPSSTVHDRT